MPGSPLPPTDHVSRLCPRSKCDDNGEPAGASFIVTDGHDYLSVNWLERTEYTERENQLVEVRSYLRNKLKSLPATGRLAVLQLQAVFSYVLQKANGLELSAHHEPELDPTGYDPTHSGIYGYTHQDAKVADLIAEVVSEHYPARDP